MTLWNLYQKIPKRYILCLLAFLGLTNAAILHANLSIAIVAMVKPPNYDNTLVRTTGFDWSPKTQQIILSSSYYSFIIMQIPAAIITTLLDGKYLFGIPIGLAGFLTLFTSLFARIGPGALITLRVLEAICFGFPLPALFLLLSKWAPKDDKSKLTTFAVSGYFGGIFIAMALGGLIAAYWSWEWIFYLSGGSAIIWAILWLCFVTESPSTHPTITSEELTYIESNIHKTVIRNHSIPWRRILTSLPVWAIIIAHFGTGFIITTMFAELPIILTHVLRYRVDEAGGLASFPWLLYAIVLFGGGIVSDKLIQHHPTIYVRKIIITIAFTIASLALLCIILLNAQQRVLIVVSIMIVLSASALAASSFTVNHLEIGGQYAGLLTGLTAGATAIAGILIPLLVAQFVPHTNSKEEWNFIFIFLISTSIATLLVFMFFGSTDVQQWVNDTSDEHQSVLNKTKASEENNIDDLTNRLRSELNSDNKNAA